MVRLGVGVCATLILEECGESAVGKGAQIVAYKKRASARYTATPTPTDLSLLHASTTGWDQMPNIKEDRRVVTIPVQLRLWIAERSPLPKGGRCLK